MHDKNGTPLKEGDIVLVPAIIKSLYPTEDYCNISLESVHGRRPDGVKEQIYAINTGVVILHDRPQL